VGERAGSRLSQVSRAGRLADADRAAVEAQLGRPPRAMRSVAHRCPCGNPDVVETSPRLPDGTPFPTLYYLTCPRAGAAVGRLESAGVMREMSARLTMDPDLAAAYLAAHRAYLARRRQLGVVPEIEGVSAGGMPNRVKCVHVLVAHALAVGPGTNPLGDEALRLLPAWWADGPCVSPVDDPAALTAAGSDRLCTRNRRYPHELAAVADAKREGGTGGT
jgi:hypothetical protein